MEDWSLGLDKKDFLDALMEEETTSGCPSPVLPQLWYVTRQISLDLAAEIIHAASWAFTRASTLVLLGGRNQAHLSGPIRIYTMYSHFTNTEWLSKIRNRNWQWRRHTHSDIPWEHNSFIEILGDFFSLFFHSPRSQFPSLWVHIYLHETQTSNWYYKYFTGTKHET